ncbi:MAG: hypothetical protein ABW221_16725 [Vicinamibacteria bacterium]
MPVFAWLLAAAAPLVVPIPWTAADALLDGRCTSDEYADAAVVDLGADQRALLRRDASRLWVCIPLRPDSLGTMDLFLVTPRETTPVRLHVSAQAGESTLRDGEWPDAPWWNARGWAAPWVAFDGFDREGAGRRARFAPSAARELALDLARFGEGLWRFRIELRHARDAGGRTVAVAHPYGSSDRDPAGWATLDTGGAGRAPAPSAGVGYLRVHVADRSRSSSVRVPVDAWYPSPAEAAGAAPTVGALASAAGGCGAAEPSPQSVEAAVSELRRWGGRPADPPAIARWLAAPLEGVSCGAALPAAAVPWVVLASPLPAWGHASLAAALARSGIAVAEVRSTSWRDLAAVASELPRLLPFLDASRLGVASFGGAASAAVLFAAQHDAVAGIATIDGSETWRTPAQRLERHPEFDASRLTGPYLRVAAAGRAGEDRRILAAATRLAGEEILIDGLSPSDHFAPLGLSSLARDASFPGEVLGEAATDVRAVTSFGERRVVAFFAERFGGPPPADEALPPGVRWAPIAGLPAPAIQHDGGLDESLWARTDAHSLFREGAPAGAVRVASDAHYLYVAVDRGRPGRFSTELVVGPDTASRASWTPDDWWMHASQSVCESRGSYGAFDGCGRAVAWTVTRSQADAGGRAAEYAIAWRKLGLAGPPAGLRIGVRLVDDQGPAVWPRPLDPLVPSTWAIVDPSPPR